MEKSMSYSRQCAEAFDEWIAELPELDRLKLEMAVETAKKKLPSVGDMAAKELIVSVLLYCQKREVRREIVPVLQKSD